MESMRCKNCGWPNKPGETTCAKCGTPLENSNYELKGRNLGATIPEDMAFGDNEEDDEKVCPKCGYPMRKNSSKCPNCNYEVPQSQSGEGKANRPTRMDNPAQNSVKGTINPYMMEAEAEPSFVLRPIKRTNEKKELTDLGYEGKLVTLTRSNTEENNESITSQQQAEVTFSEGRWYIEDKSSQGTTFVRATKKMELQDGDVILLGNRLFEFHK